MRRWKSYVGTLVEENPIQINIQYQVELLWHIRKQFRYYVRRAVKVIVYEIFLAEIEVICTASCPFPSPKIIIMPNWLVSHEYIKYLFSGRGKEIDKRISGG